MTRAIIGNLDCEIAWVGGPPLPPAVVARLALLATTLRAFCPDDVDDVVLWLPAPVPARALPDLGPRPRLVSGPLPSAALLLPWGTGSGVATNRNNEGISGHRTRISPEAPAAWREDVWHLPLATVDIARAASDRRLAHAIAAELGVAVPGTTTITTVDQLRAHLAAGGADASPSGAWVVKAPVTAAGRERVKRHGRDLEPAVATRVARLCAQHGALVFEPWLDRIADVAIGGLVTGAARARLLPPHRPWCDAAGVVRGIVVDDGAGLEPAWRAELERVATAVAARLGALGYRGPFVVDALVHRTATGPRLHPLVEINPRLTFGLVARAWAERTGLRTLGLGGPPPPGARPLVLDAAGAPAAWLADAISE